MNIKKSVVELIGNTPLLDMAVYQQKVDRVGATLLVKLESFNPAGSSKDRAAFYIINEGIKSGKLDTCSTIIEPTSGNTGIGIAMVAAAMGLKSIMVMPSSMSVERQRFIKAYGAQIVLSDASLGMQGAVDKANQLASELPNSIIAGQFDNPNNVLSHIETTGPEIYRDTDGKVDIFVAGVGTGGSISGVGKYLKTKNPNIQIVAVEPDSSPLISKGYAGAHKLQGIGANFVPANYDPTVVDKVMTVANEDAFDTAKTIARSMGVLVGISSGASIYAASVLASLPENKGKVIVALAPDGGDRYLSTDLYFD